MPARRAVRLTLFGAGGHAREALDAVLASRAADRRTLACVVDTAAQRDASLVASVPVVLVAAWRPVRGGWGFVAVGDPGGRRAVATARDAAVGGRWRDVVHPSAVVAADLGPHAGRYVAALAYVGPDAVLGPHAHVNRGAHVAHDARIGAFVHVACGAQVLGGAAVGDGTEVGANAVVLPGVRVGAGCRVGAGAVVTRDLADGVVAVGVPARPRRGKRP